jgi:pimeloyl-ACP methyl ester carboxylesterase
VAEEPFEISVDGVVLSGRRGGSGPPALLLHGGPGLPDYTEPLAAELEPLVSVMRYTQRGVEPSAMGPPYSVEVHAADALAVLDDHGVDRAWVIGHSWGGHLALHLAVTHPERLLGIVCVDTLGADSDVLEEYRQNFRSRTSAEEWVRIEELDARSEDAEASVPERERAALECHHLLWPHYFADPGVAGRDYLDRYGVECAEQTFASVKKHFERGTLADGLPSVRMPALFVHGEDDPLPVRCSTETAARMQDATIELVPHCGHFPWLERPGAVADAFGRFLARS